MAIRLKTLGPMTYNCSEILFTVAGQPRPGMCRSVVFPRFRAADKTDISAQSAATKIKRMIDAACLSRAEGRMCMFRNACSGVPRRSRARILQVGPPPHSIGCPRRHGARRSPGRSSTCARRARQAVRAPGKLNIRRCYSDRDGCARQRMEWNPEPPMFRALAIVRGRPRARKRPAPIFPRR